MSDAAPPSARRLLLLANDRAQADETLRAAVDRLRARRHGIAVRALWEPGQAELFARRAAAEGFDAVIAAGGDGTLNETVNGVLAAAGPADDASTGDGTDGQPPIAVGVLPYGTANDFASSCGALIDQPSLLLDHLVTVRPTPIDVGRTGEGRWFVNAASGGFGAQITTETPQPVKRLFGGLAYSMTALSRLAGLASRRVTVTGEGFSWSGELLALVVANGRCAGGGHVVAPAARLDDGLLDVGLLPQVEMESLPALIRDFFHRDRVPEGGYETVEMHRSPWVEIDAPDGLHLNVDGEPLHGECFRLEAVPGILPFLLGENALCDVVE